MAGYFIWGVAPASHLLPMMLLSDNGRPRYQVAGKDARSVC